MVRAAKIIVLAAVLVIAVIVVSFFAIVRRGFSAREEPGRIEAFVAKRVRDGAIPRIAKDMQNPVAASKEVLSEAMVHFADHCAICHDNDGSGNTIVGKGLYPKPPDMRQSGTQNLTDGDLFYIIHNGVRLTGMPAFGIAGDPDLDSWKLVHFIRHLASITPEEVGQMKEMNPKSPEEFKEEEEIKKFLEGDDAPVEAPAHKHH